MFRRMSISFLFCSILIGMGSASALSQGSPADPWQGVTPQVLTDQQFADVLNIMTAMAEGNVTIDADTSESAEGQIAAVKKNPAAMQILSDHSYTPETFHPVVVNAMIAFSMKGAAERKQDIEGAIEALKSQKDVLTAEQYDQALAEISAQLSVLNSVPAENVTLAAKHQNAFAALRNAGQ